MAHPLLSMEPYYIVEFDLQIMAAAVDLPSLDRYLLSQLFLAVTVAGWFKPFPKLQLSKYTWHTWINTCIVFYKIKNCQQVVNNSKSFIQ